MKNPIITLNNPPKISGSYSVVGHKEAEGPLGNLFNEACLDDKFGKDSWEEAESEMKDILAALEADCGAKLR